MKTIALAVLYLSSMTGFGGAVFVSHGGGQVGPTPGFQLYNGNQMAQQAEARQQEQLREARLATVLSIDPWRIVNGHTNHITAHWVIFHGKILQVSEDGVRIQGGYYNLDGSQQDVLDTEDADYFVKNFPYQVAENDSIGGVYVAIPSGTYTYTTISGASRTIHALDYCAVCGAPAVIQPTAEQIKAAKLAQEAKKKSAEAATLKWNQDQSAAGDAYGELRMGERYRDGDGVPKDLAKARDMFSKSAAQGNKDATADLQKLGTKTDPSTASSR